MVRGGAGSVAALGGNNKVGRSDLSGARREEQNGRLEDYGCASI